MPEKVQVYELKKQVHLEHLSLAVKRVKRKQNRNLNYHDHSYSELAIITSAGAKTLHWANGKSCQLRRGDVLLLHPGTVHAYENTGQLALTNIIYNAKSLPLPPLDGYDLKCLSAFFDASYKVPSPEMPIVHLEGKQLKTVLSLTKQFEEQLTGNKPGKHLCAFGLFIAMSVEIARVGDSSQASDHLGSLATPALQFINLNYCENLKIKDLASMCHLSTRTFHRYFKELTGYSPKDYMMKKRLEHARQMLTTTGSSLKHIANICGFCDTSHFISMFSKHYGTPPGKYRSKN